MAYSPFPFINHFSFQGFLYVSTAYCNSMVRGPIMETVYPTWIDPYELLELSKKPDLTDEKLRSILGGHSNTYSFTKHLAEEVLRREHGSLPIAIVRPSLGTSPSFFLLKKNTKKQRHLAVFTRSSLAPPSGIN